VREQPKPRGHCQSLQRHCLRCNHCCCPLPMRHCCPISANAATNAGPCPTAVRFVVLQLLLHHLFLI
jgi:hypothetical protein